MNGQKPLRVPLWLGGCTVVGLAGALVGGRPFYPLSWAALLVPIATILLSWRRSRQQDAR